MRFLLCLMILSSIALAQSEARNLRLNCTLKYDIDDKDEIEIPMTIKNGMTTFHTIEENLVTYYIPMLPSVAQWHNDSKIEFSAQLHGEVLLYTYDFKNYLRDESELVSVFTETRSLALDFDEIDDAEIHYFDFDDGDIIESHVNKDAWINETGIELDECEIWDADLRSED